MPAGYRSVHCKAAGPTSVAVIVRLTTAAVPGGALAEESASATDGISAPRIPAAARAGVWPAGAAEANPRLSHVLLAEAPYPQAPTSMTPESSLCSPQSGWT